ncbi:MAG: RusA family crossover junction endodeoxyribonuclease [Bacteroidota bacterium]
MRKLKKGEIATFWANPFYDDVIVFRDNVPTLQDRFKPLDTENKLFELIENNAVTKFKKSLRERLNNKLKPTWPYKENLFIAFSLTGYKKNVYNKDLDNILKPVFDALKGIVFVDDKQIIKLTAEKRIDDRISGVTIGIKKLIGKQDIQLCPYMWCLETDSWIEERSKKIENNEHTYMDYY